MIILANETISKRLLLQSRAKARISQNAAWDVLWHVMSRHGCSCAVISFLGDSELPPGVQTYKPGLGRGCLPEISAKTWPP